MFINYKKEKGFTRSLENGIALFVLLLNRTKVIFIRLKTIFSNIIFRQCKTMPFFSAGFTLVETLVAISILMIAIASPINLAQKALLSSVLSRDQMTASFLAQDGLEAVKNLRDEIAIRSDSTGWLSPFSDCMCGNGRSCDLSITSCNIDTTKDDLAIGSITQTTNTPSFLKIETDTTSGAFTKYDYGSGSASKFLRFINIATTTDPSGNEAVVQVRVCWPDASCSQKVEIKNFIYNYSPLLI